MRRSLGIEFVDEGKGQLMALYGGTFLGRLGEPLEVLEQGTLERALCFPECSAAQRRDYHRVHVRDNKSGVQESRKDETGLVKRQFLGSTELSVQLPVFQMGKLTRIARGHPAS